MTTDDTIDSTTLSPRKQAIRELADRLAPVRNRWIARNAYYYDEDRRYMRFLIEEGLNVLELGCGTGHLLAALRPSHGVGVDMSRGMIEIAQADNPGLEFHIGDVEDPAAVPARRRDPPAGGEVPDHDGPVGPVGAPIA